MAKDLSMTFRWMGSGFSCNCLWLWMRNTRF